MTSISIPFPKSSRPSNPPKLSFMNRKHVSKKKENDTQGDNPTPAFSYLKRNSRWGSVMEKMSKPGQPPPKPTQKHTKEAVIERARQEGWLNQEAIDNSLEQYISGRNQNSQHGQSVDEGHNDRDRLTNTVNESNLNSSMDNTTLNKENRRQRTVFNPSRSFSSNRDPVMRSNNHFDDIQIFAKPRVNNYLENDHPNDNNDPYENDHPNDKNEDVNQATYYHGTANAIPIKSSQVRNVQNENGKRSSIRSEESSESSFDSSSSDDSYDQQSEDQQESMNLEDSIKREDTFYTNESNVKPKQLVEEDFQTYSAKSFTSESNFEESGDEDMFSPTDENDREFNEDDDDVNLSSSNEKFNQTQKISKEDMIKNHPQGRTTQNTRKDTQSTASVNVSNRPNNRYLSQPTNTPSLNYEPTPISLSNDNFTYNPQIPNESLDKEEELVNTAIDEPEISDSVNHSSQPKKSLEIRKATRPSSRVFSVQSSTDSWGSLEPQEEDSFDDNPFAAKKSMQPQSQSFPKNASQTIEESENESDDEPAPASNLVNQYFYTEQNKQKKKKKQLEKVSKKKMEQNMQNELKELREQMEFFKTENEKLRKSRDVLLNEKQKMANERIQFQKEIEKRQQEISEWKEEELKKIRKERRVLERQARANAQHVSRREQEKEIKALQDQIATMNKQNKLQTSKLKAEVDRLKEKLQSTEEERDLFRESIKRLEAERIDREFRERHQAKTNVVESTPITTDERTINRTYKSPGPSKRMSLGQVAQSPSQKGRVEALAPNNEHQEFRAYVQILQQQFNFVDTEVAPKDTIQDSKPIQSMQLNGKVEYIYRGNIREIKYHNGNIVRIFPNGYHKVLFANGDCKETFPSGKVVYYYYSADTIHITHHNKLEVFRFPNGQTERHYPDEDRTKEIIFPNRSIKLMNARFGSIYENPT